MSILRYSPSTIKKCKSCPFMVYCKKTKQEMDRYTDQSYGKAGTVVHDVLEYYYSKLDSLPLTFAIEECKGFFNNRWELAKILNPKIDVNVYWDCVINGIEQKIIPTHFEHEFKFNDPVEFIGYADIINTNKHWIGDWKTSTYKAAKVREYKEQLRYYAYAYYKEFGTIPDTWVHFNKVNKRFNFVWTKEDMFEVKQELIALDNEYVQRFKELDFPRQPSRRNCYFCCYKKICSGSLLRVKSSEKYKVIFHLKKQQVMVEAIIPEIIHRKIEKEINYKVKNAHFIIKALKKKGIHYDGIKRLYRRRAFGGITGIGYMNVIYRILKEYVQSIGQVMELELKDYRDQKVMTNEVSMPKTINVPFKFGEGIYSFQNEAVKILVENRWGVAEIGTGGGKTAIAAECIRQLATKTLFVIDNKDLLLQTKTEYEEMLNMPCGIVGMGKREWGHSITLATIQTLVKHLKEFKNYLSEFNLIIFDECLCGSTRIQTEDGRMKLSKLVKEKYSGKVLSYNHKLKTYEWKKVIGWLKTEKRNDYFRVYIKNHKGTIKKLIMTPNHKLFINEQYQYILNAKVGDKIKCKVKTFWSNKAIAQRYGEGNPAYTGNRQHKSGERIFCIGKYRYEHQKVFCEHYNIVYIPSEFCIHHLDLNPENNHIKNLLLMTDKNHKSYHTLYGNNEILEKAQKEESKLIEKLQLLKEPIKEIELAEGEIIKIEKGKYKSGLHFYDITVEDNHNFFVEGILSSNCHSTAADSFTKLSKYLVNSKYRFNFSATARRDDGDTNIIYNTCGPIIYKKNAKELIDLGVLMNPKIIFYKIKTEIQITDTWQDAYVMGIVENEKRNKMILDIADQYPDKQIMILCTRVKHCQYFVEKIPDAKLIYGKTDDDIRFEVLNDFKSGKLRILVGNLKIFNKGLNIKNLNVLINTSGSAGEVITIQTIGRTLRKDIGKKDAIYIDFIDGGDYLNKHSMRRIEALKKEHYEIEIKELENG